MNSSDCDLRFDALYKGLFGLLKRLQSLTETEKQALKNIIKTVNQFNPSMEHFLEWLFKKALAENSLHVDELIFICNFLNQNDVVFNVGDLPHILLSMVSRYNQIQLAQFLIETVKLKIDTDSSSHPIIVAFDANQKEVLKYLLDKSCDYSSHCPLHLSIRNNHELLFEHLLANSWPLHSVNLSGLTPILHAVALRRQKMVTALIHNGANLFDISQDKNRVSFFHLVYQKQDVPWIESFLSLFPQYEHDLYDVDKYRDSFGLTPVHHAIRAHKNDIVKHVCEKKSALADIKDAKKRSLAAIAINSNNLDAIRYLYEHHNLFSKLEVAEKLWLFKHCAHLSRLEILKWFKENTCEMPSQLLGKILIQAIIDRQDAIIRWSLEQEDVSLKFIYISRDQEKYNLITLLAKHAFFSIIVEYDLIRKIGFNIEMFNQQFQWLDALVSYIDHNHQETKGFLSYLVTFLNQKQEDGTHLFAYLLKTPEGRSRIQWLYAHFTGLKRANLDANGSSLLQLCCEQQDLEMIHWCQEKLNLPILKRRHDGMSALKLSLQSNNVMICNYLIAQLSNTQWNKALKDLKNTVYWEQLQNNHFYGRAPVEKNEKPAIETTPEIENEPKLLATEPGLELTYERLIEAVTHGQLSFIKTIKDEKYQDCVQELVKPQFLSLIRATNYKYVQLYQLLRFSGLKPLFQQHRLQLLEDIMEHHDEQILLLFLKQPADISFWMEHGFSLLYKAFQLERYDLLLVLLQNDDIASVAHHNDNQLLLDATKKGITQVVLQLLKLEQVVKNADIIENEPLRGAANADDLQACEALLQIPCVIESLKMNDYDLVKEAFQKEFYDLIQLMRQIPHVNEFLEQNENKLQAADGVSNPSAENEQPMVLKNVSLASVKDDTAYSVENMDCSNFAHQNYANPEYGYDANQGYEYGANQGYEYGANQGYEYGVNQGNAYGTNQEYAYDMNHGHAYDMNHGHAYDMNHGHAYDMNHGHAYDMNHGHVYDMNHGHVYDMNHGHVYDTNQGYGANQFYAYPITRGYADRTYTARNMIQNPVVNWMPVSNNVYPISYVYQVIVSQTYLFYEAISSNDKARLESLLFTFKTNDPNEIYALAVCCIAYDKADILQWLFNLFLPLLKQHEDLCNKLVCYAAGVKKTHLLHVLLAFEPVQKSLHYHDNQLLRTLISSDLIDEALSVLRRFCLVQQTVGQANNLVLSCAITRGHEVLVKALLKCDSAKKQLGVSSDVLLKKAIEQEYYTIVALLLDDLNVMRFAMQQNGFYDTHIVSFVKQRLAKYPPQLCLKSEERAWLDAIKRYPAVRELVQEYLTKQGQPIAILRRSLLDAISIDKKNPRQSDNIWCVLSDILKEKISVKQFFVSDSEIFFERNSKKEKFLLSDLNRATLDNLLNSYNETQEISSMCGKNNEERCANYVSSIISSGSQQKWRTTSLIQNWQKDNLSGYKDCMEFVLEHGDAQAISSMLNAAKGTMILKIKKHERALQKILEKGSSLLIAMALCSSPANAQTITAYAQGTPQYHLGLRSLSYKDIKNIPSFVFVLRRFVAKLGSSNKTVSMPFFQQAGTGLDVNSHPRLKESMTRLETIYEGRNESSFP